MRLIRHAKYGYFNVIAGYSKYIQNCLVWQAKFSNETTLFLLAFATGRFYFRIAFGAAFA